MELLALAQKTIAERKLLAPHDSVLIALSGGPDSVALTHLLGRLRRRMGLKLTALYINHQIRPKAARKEETFCRHLCRRLRIPLIIESADVPALARQHKTGVEETGRTVRYQLLATHATALGCTRIALGHHADDRVETALFRLFRGSGRTGLVGMPAKRGQFIRPLFDVRKADILAYLKKRKISYCHDRSNETSRFRRNFIRNRLLPMIRKGLNPQADLAILNYLDTATPEEAFLERQVDKVARQVTRKFPSGKIELDFTLYDRYDIWIWRRLVRRCLQASSGDYPPTAETVARVIRQIGSGPASLSLPGRLTSYRVERRLVFVSRVIRIPEQPLKFARVAAIPELGLRLTVRRLARSRVSVPRERRSLKVCVDAAKVNGPLRIRSWKPGDRFASLGMSGRRKVSDLLVDRKIPAPYRDEVLVVYDNEGIVWLTGIEIADRVKLTATTNKVICAELRARKTVPLTSV